MFLSNQCVLARVLLWPFQKSCLPLYHFASQVSPGNLFDLILLHVSFTFPEYVQWCLLPTRGSFLHYPFYSFPHHISLATPFPPCLVLKMWMVHLYFPVDPWRSIHFNTLYFAALISHCFLFKSLTLPSPSSTQSCFQKFCWVWFVTEIILQFSFLYQKHVYWDFLAFIHLNSVSFLLGKSSQLQDHIFKYLIFVFNVYRLPFLTGVGVSWFCSVEQCGMQPWHL